MGCVTKFFENYEYAGLLAVTKAMISFNRAPCSDAVILYVVFLCPLGGFTVIWKKSWQGMALKWNMRPIENERIAGLMGFDEIK